MANIELTAGIDVLGQIPVNAKKYSVSLEFFRSLGDGNHLAYKFYKGLVVYCAENDKSYQWREEKEPGEPNGMLSESFTYPSSAVANGIDYSNKTFNWFLKKVSAEEVDGGGNDNGGGQETIKTYHTWMKFATQPDGSDMQDSSQGMTYMGIAIEKLIPESEDPNSLNPTFYVWTPIGDSVSYVGSDGETYYIHIKYSDYPDGREMVDIAGTKKYVGISYRNLVAQESEDPNDYEWSLILGDIQEPPKVFYQWFKFADDAQGTNMSDSSEGKLFMGIAIDKDSPIESTDPLDYNWNPLTGEQGYTGPDGKTYYAWVKWAMTNTPSPSEMSDDPEGMLYMGVSTNQLDSNEGTDYRDYEWSKTALNTISVEQNNKIRTIEISSDELDSLDQAGFANWVNKNLIQVAEDEIVGIEVNGGATEVPTLDTNILLHLLVSNIGETTANAFWNNNGDTAIVRYELYYTPKFGGDSKIISTDLDTAVLSNLIDGTVYLAYLVAYDTLGNSKTSSTQEFETNTIFIPSTPILKLDGITDVTVDLSWNIEDSFGADRFELYQVGVGVIYDGPDKNFLVEGLLEDTLYEFYVIAYNGATASNESVHSIVTTLQTIDPPLTKPFLTYLSSTKTTIVFSIDGIPQTEYSRIIGYDLRYRVLGNSTWTPYALNNVTLHTLSSLLPSEAYEMQARSTDGNIYSDWSDSLIASTEDEESASISLKFAHFLDTPIDYIGNLSLFNGVPNSKVQVEFKLDVFIGNFKTIGQIEFYLLEVFGSSKILNSGRPYTAEITLDENGEYGDAYRLIEEYMEYGTRFVVTAKLLTSQNGIDPDFSEDSVEHTSNQTDVNETEQ